MTHSDIVEDVLRKYNYTCFTIDDSIVLTDNDIKAIENHSRASEIISFKCYGQYAITKLPELSNVEDVYINGCSKIEAFPKWPNVKRITALDVSNVKECQMWPNLQQMELLPAIMPLLNWPNLTHIGLYAGAIKTLPAWKSIKHINCASCYSLEYIPYMPSLEILYISHCPALQCISHRPTLQKKYRESFAMSYVLIYDVPIENKVIDLNTPVHDIIRAYDVQLIFGSNNRILHGNAEVTATPHIKHIISVRKILAKWIRLARS